jgi:hypothetical protein
LLIGHSLVKAGFPLPCGVVQHAKELFQGLKLIPAEERHKILESISTNAFRDEDRSSEKLLMHLDGDEFTAQEAVEYLEVSMSTFRRYAKAGKLHPSSNVGRNQMYAVKVLKKFKRVFASQ